MLRNPTFRAGRFLCLLLLAATYPGLAIAQTSSETVRLHGRPLFRVWEASPEAAAARARRIERRAELLLDQEEVVGQIIIRPRGGERLIFAGPVLVATVMPLDSEEELEPVDVLARRWAGVLQSALERERRQRVSWGRFESAVGANVRSAFSRVGESAITIIPGMIAALLVLGVFWAIASAVRILLTLLFRRAIEDVTIESLIKQTIYYSIWLIGLVIAIHAMGFDPATAVAALGLTGLALGFALKDILSNLVSGVLMLALRPFKIGDQIVVGETEGAVERIRLRATHIRTYDGRLVLVPNAELFTSRVTNNTASPQRRTTIDVPVGYGTEPSLALRVAREAADSAPGVIANPEPLARLQLLGESDMIISVQFWSDSTRSDVVTTAAEVRRAIVEGFRREGIELPDPARRVVATARSAEDVS